MDIMGELAKVFMVWWDKQVLRKLSDLGITPSLYKRYVDDMNVATDPVDENVAYVGGSLIRSDEGTSDGIEPDERTFNIIRDVGSEIHRSIQLTRDVPSDNADRKILILDLKCWREMIEMKTAKEDPQS